VEEGGTKEKVKGFARLGRKKDGKDVLLKNQKSIKILRVSQQRGPIEKPVLNLFEQKKKVNIHYLGGKKKKGGEGVKVKGGKSVVQKPAQNYSLQLTPQKSKKRMRGKGG